MLYVALFCRVYARFARLRRRVDMVGSGAIRLGLGSGIDLLPKRPDCRSVDAIRARERCQPQDRDYTGALHVAAGIGGTGLEIEHPGCLALKPL
jgi:hypothetical protein